VEAFTRISNEDIDLKKGRGVRLANLIVQESRHDRMFSRNELRLQLFWLPLCFCTMEHSSRMVASISFSRNGLV
jgi:hypothetical protein